MKQGNKNMLAVYITSGLIQYAVCWHSWWMKFIYVKESGMTLVIHFFCYQWYQVVIPIP